MVQKGRLWTVDIVRIVAVFVRCAARTLGRACKKILSRFCMVSQMKVSLATFHTFFHNCSVNMERPFFIPTTTRSSIIRWLKEDFHILICRTTYASRMGLHGAVGSITCNLRTYHPSDQEYRHRFHSHIPALRCTIQRAHTVLLYSSSES